MSAVQWDTLGEGQLNFAPNEAYIGWGLYVMQKAEERGVSEAAWDLAAHIGGKDVSMWLSIYPSGFQPYRNSHFEQKYWEDAGYPAEFAEAYLASQADSYNHPNGAIEPRIPGIFDYYIAAEDEIALAVSGEKSAQDALETLRPEVGRDHRSQRSQAADCPLSIGAGHVGAEPRRTVGSCQSVTRANSRPALVTPLV